MPGNKRVRLIIDFGVEVELSDVWLQAVDALVTMICHQHEAENPGRTMWPAGHGSLMLVHPMKLDDGEPIPFDNSVYHIECCEREAYEKERNYKRDG